jgi:hypothetical protein
MSGATRSWIATNSRVNFDASWSNRVIAHNTTGFSRAFRHERHRAGEGLLSDHRKYRCSPVAGGLTTRQSASTDSGELVPPECGQLPASRQPAQRRAVPTPTLSWPRGELVCKAVLAITRTSRSRNKSKVSDGSYWLTSADLCGAPKSSAF